MTGATEAEAVEDVIGVTEAEVAEDVIGVIEAEVEDMTGMTGALITVHGKTEMVTAHEIIDLFADTSEVHNTELIQMHVKHVITTFLNGMNGADARLDCIMSYFK